MPGFSPAPLVSPGFMASDVTVQNCTFASLSLFICVLCAEEVLYV